MSLDFAPSPSAELKPAGKSRTLGTFEALRAEILDGRLHPGTRLHVAALARRFAVSQSSVREALSRLVADGLAHAIDRRGFRVSPVSLDDLRDVTATRIDIEGLALRRAIERGDAAWEAEILASLHVLQRATPGRVSEMGATLPAWSQLHERFHRALLAACGSSWLLRFRKILYEQSERYRSLTVSYAIGDRDVAGEHEALAAAALGRDAEQAVALLAGHFNATMHVLLEAYKAGAEVLSDEAAR